MTTFILHLDNGTFWHGGPRLALQYGHRDSMRTDNAMITPLRADDAGARNMLVSILDQLADGVTGVDDRTTRANRVLELEASLQDYVSKYTSLERTLSEARAAVASADKAANTYRSSLDAKVSEISELRKQIAQQRDGIESLEKECGSLRVSFKNSRAEIDKQCGEIVQLRTNLAAMEQARETMRTRAQRSERERDTERRLVEAIRADLVDACNRRDEMSRTYDKSREQVTALAEERSALEVRLDATIRENEQRIATYASELAGERATISQLRATLENTRRGSDDHEKNLRIVRTEAKALADVNDRNWDHIEQLLNMLDSIEGIDKAAIALMRGKIATGEKFTITAPPPAPDPNKPTTSTNPSNVDQAREILKRAETLYTMINSGGGPSAQNMRDRHLAYTIAMIEALS